MGPNMVPYDFLINRRDQRQCDEETNSHPFVRISGMHGGLGQALGALCCFR